MCKKNCEYCDGGGAMNNIPLEAIQPTETAEYVCENCKHEPFLHTASGECIEWQCVCDGFESKQEAVAVATRKEDADECSICRGRHGPEVQHACE